MYYNIEATKCNIPVIEGEKYVIKSSTYTSLEFRKGDPIIVVPTSGLYSPASFTYKWEGESLVITDSINSVLMLEKTKRVEEVTTIYIKADKITKLNNSTVSGFSFVDTNLKISSNSRISNPVLTINVGNKQYSLVRPLKVDNDGTKYWVICDLVLEVVDNG